GLREPTGSPGGLERGSASDAADRRGIAARFLGRAGIVPARRSDAPLLGRPPVSRQNDVLGRCKGCGAPPEEACVCGAAVRASTAPDVRRALARCALALSREADTIRE